MMSSEFFTIWFLPGVWITVQVTLYAAVLGAAVSFGIGLARDSRLWIVRFAAGAYFEVFRGMSALVLMFWMFFALPLFGWQLEPMWAGVSALGLTYGAYGSEIVRGSLAAVPTAQKEAGVALDFTRWQRLRLIELPQAWPDMVPPFNNLLIELLKGTALVSVITVADMTFAGNLLRLGTNQTTPIYTLLLALYFVLAFVITRGMRMLERRAKAGIGERPEKSGGIGAKTGARGDGPRAGSRSAGGVR
ncbi:ectoine/hydroxyectoine ABC transporter permease subunit EhuC [Streptomyces rishiriensis]|uniref:ectoine/hydroxyectoine ABC transporter permease subunit EhuC n=1 Tax=Streptomyces rishiriensis TaxID=68264 RepID=UPI000D59B442|nr:ectoine/hydroxyectoine ABC transporter permease subunit EhuC [Streptomyces rishiriensis]